MRPLYFIIILILISLASLLCGLTFWKSFENYSPNTYRLYYSKSTTPLVNQVVVIIVDGLRLDIANEMYNINILREQGAGLTCKVGFPSYSRPGYSVLATGAYQDISGIVLNYPYSDTSKIDSIFRSAKRQGLKTALVGYGWWDELFGKYIDYKFINPEIKFPTISSFSKTNKGKKFHYGFGDLPETPENEEVIRCDESIKILHEKKPNLMYIHFQQTDNDAHDYGARSLQYRNSLASIDRQIGRIAVAMDFNNSVLIITSDHGHIDRGGHGGTEKEATIVPLILVGKNIKPYYKHIKFDYKSPIVAEQVDIPVTVSALLGIPPPTSSQGRILFEVIEMSDKDMAEKQFQLAGTQYRFYSEYLLNLAKYRPRESTLEQGEDALDEKDYRFSFVKSSQALDELKKDFENVKEEFIKKERLIRSVIFTILLALPFTFILSSRFFIPSLIGIIAGIVYISVFNVIFYISGNTYSFSTINSAQIFIIQIILFSFISSIFSYTTIIYLNNQGKKLESRNLKLEIIVSSILSLFPLYLIAIIGYLIVGMKVSRFIPDAKWSFYMFTSELILCINGISLAIFIVIHYVFRRLYSNE